MELLVVDDHPLIRQGIRSVFIQGEPDSVVWEAGCIEEAVALIKEHEVSIAVVDLKLKEESGFTLIERLREHEKKLKCIILSSSTKARDLQKAKGLQVDGYVEKDARLEDVLYAVRLVARGGQFFSPGVAQLMYGLVERQTNEQLTKREQEVWQLVREGRTNAQIGQQLYISESTAKKHVSSLLAKLHLKHRVELALYEK